MTTSVVRVREVRRFRESVRNEIGHRSRNSVNLHQQRGAAVFPQQLAAPTAQGDRGIVAERADGDEPTADRQPPTVRASSLIMPHSAHNVKP